MDAESIQETLKIFNFTTIYAILMKLTTDIYLNKVFHLAKSWGVILRVWEGVKKLTKWAKKLIFLNTSIKTVAYLMHHLACHQRSKLQTKLTTLGYCRKNPNTLVKDILFWKPPLEFLDLSLYPKKFQRKQAHPGNFFKVVWHPLEISRSKTKTDGNYTIFSCTPLEIPLLF